MLKKTMFLTLLAAPQYLVAKDNFVLFKKTQDTDRKILLRSIHDQSTDSAAAIHVHDFFWNEHTMSVFKNGKHNQLSKDDLLGYRNNSGTFYRFFKNEEYQLIDTLRACIYVKYELVPAGKSYQRQPRYFYSETLATPIHILSAETLRSSGFDTATTDSILKKYSVNHETTFHFSPQPTTKNSFSQPHTK